MIPPNTSRAGESPTCHSRCGDGVPGVLSEELIFDAGKLHSQLADLLKLYLARAADLEAVEACTAKDAIACAKALTAMMSDVQSGKPASIKKGARWPRLESSFVGARHAVPSYARGDTRARHVLPLQSTRPTSYVLPSTRSNPILDDALAAVLSTDQESHIPEPHMRFIARADRLCKEVRKRLDVAQSKNHQPTSNNRASGGRAAPRCPT